MYLSAVQTTLIPVHNSMIVCTVNVYCIVVNMERPGFVLQHLPLTKLIYMVHISVAATICLLSVFGLMFLDLLL